jgi:hypothetical protein
VPPCQILSALVNLPSSMKFNLPSSICPLPMGNNDQQQREQVWAFMKEVYDIKMNNLRKLPMQHHEVK